MKSLICRASSVLLLACGTINANYYYDGPSPQLMPPPPLDVFPGDLRFVPNPERIYGGGGGGSMGNLGGRYYPLPLYGEPAPRPRMGEESPRSKQDYCSSSCLHSTQCKSFGGQATRNICPSSPTNFVCCQFDNSCSHSTTQDISFFKSPAYPEPTLGNLICQYDVILRSGVCAVKLEFIEFNTTIPLDRGICNIDQFIIMNSLDGATFPRCGELTGYSTIIAVDARHKLPITLLSIIQSSAEEYKWNIKVTQVKCSAVKAISDYPNCGKTFMTEADSTSKEKTTPIPRTEDDENVIFDDDQDTEQIYYNPSRNKDSKQVDNAFYIAYLKQAYEMITNVNSSTTPEGGNGTLCKNKKEEVIINKSEKLLRTDDDELARIIGGDEAFPNEFPWQVSIQDTQGHICGGVIISTKSILTAAHCYMSIEPVPLTGIKIVVGDLDFNSSKEAKDERVEVESVLFHSHFDPYYLENDIALIRLKKELNFRPGVQPACLPEIGNSYTGQNAIISGWGATTFPGGKIASFLMKSKNTIIENSECKKKLKIDYLYQTMICAVAPNCSGTCYGDSGGPLVLRKDKKHILIGLVSFGIGGCALFPFWPDVFTRVSAYLDWLAYAVH